VKINLKPITASIDTVTSYDVVSVYVMDNELEVKNPMVHFYTAIISCVAIHVKEVADRYGLESSLIEIELSGHIEASVFEDIGIHVNTYQGHDIKMPLIGAVMNCPVLQHMDSDIDINVVVN